MTSAVAGRYAHALADSVIDNKDVPTDQVSGQLGQFSQLVKESSEIRNILNSPAVSTVKKRAVVGRFADSLGLSRVVRNFLFVILDHRRADMLGEISEAFDSALDERLGIARAQVTSASPLDGEQQQQLAGELSRLSGKQVRCEYSVDPELIGGVVARIGSTVYDGSLRAQLEELRERLVSA